MSAASSKRHCEGETTEAIHFFDPNNKQIASLRPDGFASLHSQ